MSNSGAQTFAFYRDVAKNGRLWTVRDPEGQTPLVASDAQRVTAVPFWSTLSRVQRIIKSVPKYREFTPEELTWEEFRDHRLPELERDGIEVGVNWSGPRARGWDLAPSMVRDWIEWFIAHPGASIEEAHGQPLRTR